MTATLTVKAPKGSHFEFEEVKTAGGKDSLGSVPLLCWDSLDEATGFYGEESLLRVLDGTSLRVAYQGIARRMKGSGKSDDEIANAELAYRPGEKKVGESTPTSRAARSARAASEKVDGDKIKAFLDRLASGDISEEELDRLIPTEA